MMFGFGGLYNHSDTPNLKMVRCHDNDTIELVALRDIAQDEELCWKYSCTWW